MPPMREAEARRFYGDLLGLAEVPKPPLLAGRGGCWFECGRLGVHLGVEESFNPARKAHPAFLVHGLHALQARLEQAGVEIVEDESLVGYSRFYAYDPFGNRLELLEPLES